MEEVGDGGGFGAFWVFGGEGDFDGDEFMGRVFFVWLPFFNKALGVVGKGAKGAEIDGVAT